MNQPRLSFLVGSRCRIIFNLPFRDWPITGSPAWATIEAVEGGMFYADGKWISLACVLTIETVSAAPRATALNTDEMDHSLDAEPYLARKLHGGDATPPASPPARREWTSEMRSAACDIARIVLHKGELGYEGRGTDSLCAAISKVAPRFVAPIKVPRDDDTQPVTFDGRCYVDGYNKALAKVRAALSAAGLEVEEER